MASSFILTLDTTAPVVSSFSINSGASVTTNVAVTLTIGINDGTYTGYTMKIWGIDGVASEGDAAWQPYATSKSVNLTTGDGSKTVYIKVRDDVYNESTAVDYSITLSTAIPAVTISAGPDLAKISENDGKNTCAFSFQCDVAIKAWKVKLVPTAGSANNAGQQIPVTAGSTNMTGATLAAATAQACTIKGTDLKTAASSVDGEYVIKVFCQSAENDLWSAA